MKNIRRKLVVIGIIICSLFMVSTQSLAQPVLDAVTLDPEAPRKLSAVTFTAEISSDESIDSVYILVKECNRSAGICYPGSFNESMTNIEGSTYQVEITLINQKTTYITHQILVESQGVWYTFDESEADLDLSPVNGGNGNGGTNGDNGDNGGNGGNGTPGFELVFVVIALLLSLVIIGRRRFR